MTRKTKTKNAAKPTTPTLGTLTEQASAMLISGLKCIDQHVRNIVARPMSSTQAEQLADLCLELVRLRTALAESERASRPAAT